ncbi:MAG: methyltransferase domain-containing protein [Sandaracinaceae bacterium]
MSEPDEANKAKRRRRRRSLRVPVDEVPRPTQAVAESVEVPLEAEGGMTVEMPAYSDDASPSLAGPPTIDGDSANEFDEPRTIVEAEGAADDGDDGASASVEVDLDAVPDDDDDFEVGPTRVERVPEIEARRAPTEEDDASFDSDAPSAQPAKASTPSVGVVVQRVVAVVSAPGAQAPPPEEDDDGVVTSWAPTEPGSSAAEDVSVDLDEPEITVDAEDDAEQDDAGERALDGESDAEVEELDVDLDADAPDDDAAPELAEDELLEEDGAGRPSKPPPPPRGEKAPPPPPEKAAEKAEPARAEKAEAKKDAAKEGAAKARARKTRRKWYETLFNDDYLRTVPIPHPRTIEKQCDFIEQRFGLAKGATILDVGCGLGLHAVELTRRGYLVVGLDLSLPMLSRAADEAQEHGFKINFLHADMREMNFDGAFDAVLCWGTTLGYFDDETNKQVIERLYRALKPRGLLLLEVVNRDYVIRTQPNLVWFEGDGCVVMEETQMNYITSRLETKRTVILDDGRQRDNLYSIRLFSLHELGQVLHHQGFRVVEVSGREAHPGVFFGADSPQLLILAERRPQGPPTPPGRGSSSSMKTVSSEAPPPPGASEPPASEPPDAETDPEAGAAEAEEPSDDVSAALAETLQQSEEAASEERLLEPEDLDAEEIGDAEDE